MMLLVLAWPGPGVAARGDDDTVSRQIEDLRRDLKYEQALELARESRQKSRDNDLYVTLSLYEGILLYELHRKDEAREAFLRAFRLRPQAQLPTHVAPQIEEEAESSRQEVLKGHPDADTPRTVEKKRPAEKKSPSEESSAEARNMKVPAPTPSRLRQQAWIPAVAGGALVVAGGVALGVGNSLANQVNHGDIPLMDTRGTTNQARTLQRVGGSLLGVGAAGLATAAGMYLLGAPRTEASALWLSTDGTSAILHGRWP